MHAAIIIEVASLINLQPGNTACMHAYGWMLVIFLSPHIDLLTRDSSVESRLKSRIYNIMLP